MCGGGGAGGQGTQRFEWNDALAPYWANTLAWGEALRDPSGFGAYEKYPGQRIADINADQAQAMDEARHFVNSPGEFLYGKGNQQFQSTLAGDYLSGDKANPYASQENKYAGDNPYFRQTMQSTLGDITSAYEQGTRADMDKMFTLSGTYGGDAHLKAQKNAQDALARNLGRTANEGYQQQYDRSAGLNESFLNRGGGAFENERGRMMGAGQASQADQGLTLQRYNALMGIGDVQRGIEQDRLNMGFNDWQNEANQQYRMADWFSGLLGRAQGGMSPNMTTTQAGYSASPFSQVLGAGLLGYGALRG